MNSLTDPDVTEVLERLHLEADAQTPELRQPVAALADDESASGAWPHQLRDFYLPIMHIDTRGRPAEVTHRRPDATLGNAVGIPIRRGDEPAYCSGSSARKCSESDPAQGQLPGHAERHVGARSPAPERALLEAVSDWWTRPTLRARFRGCRGVPVIGARAGDSEGLGRIHRPTTERRTLQHRRARLDS